MTKQGDALQESKARKAFRHLGDHPVDEEGESPIHESMSATFVDMDSPPVVEILNLREGLAQYVTQATSQEEFEDREQVMLALVKAQAELLGSKLHIQGGLNLHGLRYLRALPDNLTLSGSFTLIGLSRLQTLPEGLRVEGILSLGRCDTLKSLPQVGYVGEGLSIVDCEEFCAIPETLVLRGKSLSIFGCPKLTTLPFSVLGNFEKYTLMSLFDTAIPTDVLSGILDVASHYPSLQFDCDDSVRWFKPAAFLDSALAEWHLELSVEQLQHWGVSEEQKAQLAMFLTRLHDTADAWHGASRLSLQARLKKMMTLFETSVDNRPIILALVEEGLASSDDRAMLSMNSIELLTRIDEAKKAQNPEQALFNVGKGVFAMQIIDELANALDQRPENVDSVETALYLQIQLKQVLQLPISTHHMVFERYVRVSAEDIEHTRVFVETALAQPQVVSEFFADWGPWLEYLYEKNKRLNS